MKINEIRVMRGPNYWSIRRHKLIVMVLDLEDLEEKPTNVIDGFPERLKKMFPSMHEHRCSVGEAGGFFQRVEKAVNIPLTFRGRARFNIQNVLPTVLAGFIQGFKIADLKMALETFIPSPAQTPGRMNMFRFNNFDLMLDYAHNPAGFQAVGDFLENIEATEKVGIIAGVGNRRDEDIHELGALSAKMFDKIIIRQDKNLRGRSEESLIELMKQGIASVDPNKEVQIIPNEGEAITHAVNTAKKDSFIVICSDVVPAALDLVKKLHEEESKLSTAVLN